MLEIRSSLDRVTAPNIGVGHQYYKPVLTAAAERSVP